MKYFLTRQRERISKLGLRRTLGYYAGAAAEKAGVGVWLAYEYAGQPPAPVSHNVAYSIAQSMADWAPSDLEVLQSAYSQAQLQFFETLFATGNTCAVSKWNQDQIACICWVETTSDYYFARGSRGFKIHACYTLPCHRGKGLYPHTLAFACKHLQSEREGARIFIDTSVGNYASRRGIAKAGFVQIGTYVTLRRWRWGWPAQSASGLLPMEAGQ
jgi:RimJ/RimL family protein N-acetyltransferase